MTVSRWKVMAGVLGVSLGGLAALAGQSPKTSETRRAEPPLPAEGPTSPAPKPAGTPTLEVPPPAGLPMVPTAPTVAPPAPTVAPPAPFPILAEPPVADAKKPAKTDVTPVGGLTLPTVPVVSAGGSPITPPLPGALPLTVPATLDPPAIKPNQVPLTPAPAIPAAPSELKPTTPEPPKTSTGASVELPLPTGFTPPAPSSSNPPSFAPSNPGPAAAVAEPAAAIRVAPAAAVVAAAKFRIILRVGEGDPTFEVRSGDDLMMKVACEKVDIASAEKGQPMQQVKASGKVRFVGFGSEGTCDELSFVAGTGELQLAGNVTIQVKDKLGRVDSELKSDKVKYKIDASALPGVMKP